MNKAYVVERYDNRGKITITIEQSEPESWDEFSQMGVTYYHHGRSCDRYVMVCDSMAEARELWRELKLEAAYA